MPWGIADPGPWTVAKGQVLQEFGPAFSSSRALAKSTQVAGLGGRRPGGDLDADRPLHDGRPHLDKRKPIISKPFYAQKLIQPTQIPEAKTFEVSWVVKIRGRG